MTVFTDEQARQKLDDVLREARAAGEVRIRTADGLEYAVRPAPTGKSPLDVAGIDTGLSAEDIVSAVREGRERT